MVERNFVVRDVKIFTGDRIIDRGFVRVQAGQTAQVGEGDFEGNAEHVYSFPGDTLVPGLIDCHIHALGGNVQSIEQSLRFGVTTVCDMHNDPKDNKKLKEMAEDPTKKGLYSDFKCAGLGAVIEGGWPIPVMKKEFDHVPNGQCIADKIISTWPKLKTPRDAEPYVRQQVEENGASYIKMFHEVGDSIGMDLPLPPMDVQKAVVEAAHQRGVIAMGHAFSHAGALALIQAGADGLTHIFLDQAPSDEFVQLMKAQKSHCSPTLALCGSQTGEGEELQRQFTNDPFAQRMLLNKSVGRPVGFAISQRPKSSVVHAYRSVKALHAANVPLLVGTDAAGREIGTAYGLGVHMEMYLLATEIGMAPIEVLRSATSLTAERYGFNDRGRIEIGRKADLVLMSGDVLSALADPNSLCLPVKKVWRDGVQASAFEE